MKHQSSKQLFNYWNKVRDGRPAPNRFEIEPSSIAGILPDVFILECADVSSYKFRLAGTRICMALGHELRGVNLLDYWSGNDHEAVQNLLHNVAEDHVGAAIEFECANVHGEKVAFELLVLPLVHNGERVNRMLGSIGAHSTPYWLGTVELRTMTLKKFDLIWPDVRPHLRENAEQPAMLAKTDVHVARDGLRRFRVVDGGLSRRQQ